MGNECKYEGAITIYATLEISALKKIFPSNLKSEIFETNSLYPYQW